MEHWCRSNILPYHPHGDKAHRVLATTSGNSQSYVLDTKEGIENQNPLLQGQSIPPTAKVERQYPTPGLTLGSNDHHAARLTHLHARQQRRHPGSRRKHDSARPYLNHPEYIKYRARQRRDRGQDGKPVWDDVMEDAFQDALVAIEPMGRRKKAQHHKPYGRNELISEYIYQATGQFRGRKQVSSHIQVLKHLLEGIPEWDALIIATEDTNPRNNICYYENSIEDLVQENKAQSLSQNPHARTQYSSNLPPDTNALRPSIGHSDRHSLTGLNFEMWVSLPTQMHSALHNYTRLQSSHSNAAPILLESVKRWRTTYPDLCPITESWKHYERCDIIQLDASFQLMSDFPPQFSKLGISLELDFLHPSSNNTKGLSELQNWSCITHMYQNGNLVKQAEHNDCHVSSVGKVKPLFESKWWAATFTTLTEKKRRAEDSKNEAAIEAVSEQIRNFFRGLSVMQEIRAGPSKQAASHDTWSDQPRPQKRMAILLWKFSQAQAEYVGTTTWQKLIPPPERITTNSPPPTSQEMALPRLTMDTMVDGLHEMPVYEENQEFLAQHGDLHYPLYSHVVEEDLCHEGFMAFKDDEFTSLATMDVSFGFADAEGSGTEHALGVHDLPDMDHFGLDMEARGDCSLHSAKIRQLPPTILFDATHPQSLNTGHARPGVQSDFTNTHEIEQMRGDGRDQLPRQPLTSFDINTHTMLQAQLGHDHDQSQTHHNDHPAVQQHQQKQQQQQQHRYERFEEGTEEYALRAALVAASTMSAHGDTLQHQQVNAGSMHQDVQQVQDNTQAYDAPEQHQIYRPEQISEQQWLAPVATRPTFHSHASYLAQQGSQSPYHDQQSSVDHDTTPRSALVANLEAFDANQLAATLFVHNSGVHHCSQNRSLDEAQEIGGSFVEVKLEDAGEATDGQ